VQQSGTASGFTTTQLGTPTFTPPGAKFATGFRSTKFGRARGSAILNGRYTTGSTSTQFGTPGGRINNRVTAMPPITVFGTPVLTRNTTC
jgi:hypothetical protein